MSTDLSEKYVSTLIWDLPGREIFIMSEKKQEIEFPTTWSYRIIVDAASKKFSAAICDLLKEYGITAKLEKKDKSSSGKYQAYRLPIVFESQEMMDDLSAKISAIDGVKFML